MAIDKRKEKISEFSIIVVPLSGILRNLYPKNDKLDLLIPSEKVKVIQK